MKKILLISVVSVFFITVIGVFSSTEAIDFPCRSVKVIAPASAGGSTDIGSRIACEFANKHGAKPKLQVVNMGAQGGVEGGMALYEAKPDGCTLMFAHWNPMLLYLTGRSKVNYTDYEPVALLTSAPRAIGAAKDTPYSDLAQMVDYVKANGSDSVIAGATLGATSHFQILLIEKAMGIKIKTVSYNHSRERMTALLANNIQISDIGTIGAGKYVKSGKMKVLAVLAPERSPMLPDVPTSVELGIDVQMGLDHGFYAPKGTPKKIIDYYSEIFRKVANDPEFKKTMMKKDTFSRFKPPTEFKKHLDERYIELKALAKSIGIYKGQ